MVRGERIEAAARAVLEVLRPEYDGGDDDLDTAMDALRSALEYADSPPGVAEAGAPMACGATAWWCRNRNREDDQGIVTFSLSEVESLIRDGYTVAPLFAHPSTPAPLGAPLLALLEAKARAYDGVLSALKSEHNRAMPFGRVMADLGLDSIESVERIYFTTPPRPVAPAAPDADTPTGIPAFWGVVFAARVAAEGKALTTEGREKALSDINALMAQRNAAPDAALLERVVGEAWMLGFDARGKGANHGAAYEADVARAIAAARKEPA